MPDAERNKQKGRFAEGFLIGGGLFAVGLALQLAEKVLKKLSSELKYFS